MALSKPKDKLFDPFRKTFVAATPEERVRQRLLQIMTEKLGFPKPLIAVEKALSEFPHLQGERNLPNRRMDLVCFAKGIHKDHPLFPLLLIECKEGLASRQAKEQVLGYNHYIKAPFVAIAGANHVQLVYPVTLSFLPSYEELVQQACKQ